MSFKQANTNSRFIQELWNPCMLMLRKVAEDMFVYLLLKVLLQVSDASIICHLTFSLKIWLSWEVPWCSRASYVLPELPNALHFI